MRCAQSDPDYESPPTRDTSEEELAAGLAVRCTPSSGISTFVSPGDFL